MRGDVIMCLFYLVLLGKVNSNIYRVIERAIAIEAMFLVVIVN